jgi:hypothetical protein
MPRVADPELARLIREDHRAERESDRLEEEFSRAAERTEGARAALLRAIRDRREHLTGGTRDVMLLYRGRPDSVYSSPVPGPGGEYEPHLWCDEPMLLTD